MLCVERMTAMNGQGSILVCVLLISALNVIPDV